MSFERDYATLYDALYQDKDYLAEAEYIEAELLLNGVPTGAKVLEIGTGSGIHAAHLEAKGFQLEGIEPSENMARKARSRGIDVKIGKAESQLITVTDDSKDAVIAMFHVIGYVNSWEDLVAVFSNVHRVLRHGGIFLFDVWYRPAVVAQGMSCRIKRIQLEDGGTVIRCAEPRLDLESSVGHVRYDIFWETSPGSFNRVEELHSLRFFSLEDVRNLSLQAGLTLVDSHEFRTKRPPAEDTWGVTFVLKKL
jgi:SAM-dependent methyltransferase